MRISEAKVLHDINCGDWFLSVNINKWCNSASGN